MSTIGYKTEIDSVTEHEWSELCSHFIDANIYQTWAYGSTRWGDRNLSHIVLRDGHTPVGIAQLRLVRPKGFRAGIAYLRWGPLCHSRSRELNPDAVRAMAEALRKEYCDKRGLCLEVVPNAFRDSRRAEIFQAAFNEFECRSAVGAEEYRTFVLDLAAPLDELRSALHRRWRGYLNTAERQDLQVTEGEELERYSTFSRLYRQMLNRKRFWTGVSIEDFGRIQQRLPHNQKMRVFLCEHKGLPVAAMVCSALGDSAIYLLGASNDEMKLRASYLLHWTVVKWLKENGTRYYDLGGIDPDANPGVYQFKRGLSGVDVSNIASLVACDNPLSMMFAKASQMLNRGIRRYQRASREPGVPQVQS
jgi:hypothetical protein